MRGFTVATIHLSSELAHACNMAPRRSDQPWRGAEVSLGSIGHGRVQRTVPREKNPRFHSADTVTNRSSEDLQRLECKGRVMLQQHSIDSFERVCRVLKGGSRPQAASATSEVRFRL